MPATALCQAVLYLWPYRFYVSIRLPSALRTAAINRQPVDNQSANKCRFKIYWEFGGFASQWLSETATFSWLSEVGDRSLPLCHCSFNEQRGIKVHSQIIIGNDKAIVRDNDKAMIMIRQ